jgi:quinohemoprotein ethanol dehydrogenase
MRSRVRATRSLAAASAAIFAGVAIAALATLPPAAIEAQPAAVETSSLPPQREPPRAPAFRARELTQLPRAGWLTNGGTLDNNRYSPLTEINRDNVANLRAEWRASLDGSGMGPRSANQAQPLVYDGVIYVVTGDNDAFAIDVDTGRVLWKYTANVDPNVARPCCGWAARGLGMGGGKIFVGQLDAKVVALDQRTGKVAWSIQAEDPKLGFSITSAPLYFDGMVITGFAGGDLGTRGRVKAFDAKDGKLRWTFYTVPAPGEIGHETWPQDSDVWKYGGASVWQTPAVDPDLGLVYFSTSNPGPVLNGNVRKGDNLFSVSIVAVEAATGKYRWHFQQVHHDIWDYDSPNPIILFDAPYNGAMRKGLAQAAKTGWVYLLDRATGEPLIGIVETPVMQEPAQHTAATQPFPIGDAIVPQSLDMPLEGFELVNDGKIFTPFKDDAPVLWKPLAAVNWPPSSYDPDTRTMYICATDSFWGAQGGDPDYPVEPGALYSGSIVARVSAPRRGVFAALDVTTNRLVWRQQWTDTCYSGSITTAGGLVFVGRNDGRITALDKTNGKRLWEFQTDGGVNAPASTFERNGTQYVAVYAGGTSLAGSKRSDGVWLFSLNGSLKSLPRGSAEPSARGPAPRPITVPQDRVADVAHGRELYSQTCIACHGSDGTGGVHGAPLKTTQLSLEELMTTIGNGRDQMPAFGRAYEPEDLHDVAAFILEELRN